MSNKPNAQKRRQSSPPRAARGATYEDLAQPTWVVEMHRHFGTHGYFRASDLDRVLGSPIGFTEGRALTDLFGNGKKDS